MSKPDKLGVNMAMLIVLLAPLFAHALRTISQWGEPRKTYPIRQNYVQITGDVEFPGIYGFSRSPDLADLLLRAGGLKGTVKPSFSPPTISLRSGDRIHVRIDGWDFHLTRSVINGFHKLTLGMPLCLNEETLEGLTALPGVGPKTALRIVAARRKSAGFDHLDELMNIHGIGPKLYAKIKPRLTLRCRNETK
jgi:competence protein ComEA